jgi:hypothetical protein
VRRKQIPPLGLNCTPPNAKAAFVGGPLKPSVGMANDEETPTHPTREHQPTSKFVGRRAPVSDVRRVKTP